MRIVFVGKDRLVWRRVLYYFLTLGIYRRVWLVRTLREMDGHDGHGLPRLLVVGLAVLPVVGPYILSVLASQAAARMLQGSPISYGPTWLWKLALIIPILGPASFIGFQQGRLNRFWRHERANPAGGFEIDVDLSDDPKFLVELGEALKQSYQAGGTLESNFSKRLKARFQAMQKRQARVRQLRSEVRAAGGSTPVLFWRAPKGPQPRMLHVTCGRCETRFDATSDGVSPTTLLCPKCALVEVLPGGVGSVRQPKEKAAVLSLKVKCSNCQTRFHALRNLASGTAITCPTCGRSETLPPTGTRGAPSR